MSRFSDLAERKASPVDAISKGAAFSAIARPLGGLAMVANDARGALRGLLHKAGQACDDKALSDFKVEVARHLGPLCSAMLIDPMYGQRAMDELRSAAPRAGRILSVDSFDEARFGPLAGTSLDYPAMAVEAVPADVHALKFFVFWHPGRRASTRADDVSAFVEGCQRLGVLSLLEGVVQVPADDPRFDDLLLSAAAEFGSFSPDLYKTQVPTLGRATPEEIERLSRELTLAVHAPWVVMSNGTSSDQYADAVTAACRGGASGFLAGRAAWSPAIGTANAAQELSTTGVQRLQELADRVDRDARPWWVAVGLPQPAGDGLAPMEADG